MASPDFAEILSNTDFMPPPQLAAQQPRPVPPANPEAQGELIKTIPDDLNADKAHEPAGKDAERINGAMNRINAAIASGAAPEAKTLPPAPKIMLYNEGPYDAHTASTDKNDATVIAMSSRLLHEVSDKELKELLAHEYSHMLISANPELSNHYAPPNPESVARDWKQAGFDGTPNAKDNKYNEYKTEMLADKLAVEITGDPKSYNAFLRKIGEIHDRQSLKDIESAQKASLAEAGKEAGHSLSEATVDFIKASIVRQAFLDMPHPTAATRAEAVTLESEKREKQTPAQETSPHEHTEPAPPLPTPPKPSSPDRPLPPR